MTKRSAQPSYFAQGAAGGGSDRGSWGNSRAGNMGVGLGALEYQTKGTELLLAEEALSALKEAVIQSVDLDLLILSSFELQAPSGHPLKEIEPGIWSSNHFQHMPKSSTRCSTKALLFPRSCRIPASLSSVLNSLITVYQVTFSL